MKKLVMLIASVIILMSCSEDTNPSNSVNKDGSIFLFNGLGDVGTLSVVDNDGIITNDVMNVGKWPNHIIEDGGTLYVVNSGNNNIQMINASNNENIGSIELSAFSNPMRSVICNGKVYATNSFGAGIDVYSFDKDSLKTIPVTNVPDSCINGGTDAIVSYGDYVYVGVKNVTYDASWNAVYGFESIVVINSLTDEIVASAEIGYNISDMIIDTENELHILCAGNRNDVNGLVKVYSADDITKQNPDEIILGSQPSRLVMNSEGMIYVGIAGLNLDWSGFGGIMKYNSNTNEVLNGSNDLLYTSTESGIMDLAIDGYDKLYAPLFDKNELIIFENDSIDIVLTTGTGPQGLVFVKE
ncbi:MAG: hypothetical protein PF638_02170 [Candidatus Delongbacteria bacterium]|jgi:YVTN family beta-propeller protein|nr:hypothetical protein [Candidatus Delongbacteria bacterium]